MKIPIYIVLLLVLFCTLEKTVRESAKTRVDVSTPFQTFSIAFTMNECEVGAENHRLKIDPVVIETSSTFGFCSSSTSQRRSILSQLLRNKRSIAKRCTRESPEKQRMSSAATETAPKNPEGDSKMETGENAESSSVAKETDPSSPAPSNAVTSSETPTASTAATKSGPPSAVEFEPPVACVRRILKKTLPSSSNVGKDAVAAFARASGIFIIYLTACANDFARENRRQTITANDVLAAIKVGSLFVHLLVCLLSRQINQLLPNYGFI